MSHETPAPPDNTTDYRALIARIDGTMAALARERRRLEARADEDAAARRAETDRAR
jgi:hypothetical protein